MGVGFSLGHAEHLQASGLILGRGQPNNAGNVNPHQCSNPTTYSSLAISLGVVPSYRPCLPQG